MSKTEIPIWEKVCLTIEEAAAYSHIGENLLRQQIKDGKLDNAILCVGNRTLLKRKAFEKYLDQINVI